MNLERLIPQRRVLVSGVAAALVMILAHLVLLQTCSLGINETGSLPQRLFFIWKHAKTVAVGDYLAFRGEGVPYYPDGVTWVKRVGATAGQVITRQDDRLILPDGTSLAVKTKDIHGRELPPGPTGAVPAGCYFVWSDHDYSIDSRYAHLGWICEDSVVGRAYPLF